MSNTIAALKAKLKSLDSYFDNREYSQAINILDELLEEYNEPEAVALILRERYRYLFLLKEDEKALEDVLYIINNLQSEIVDYFRAGYRLVESRIYTDALSYLNKGIIMSEEDNDMYFYSTLLFLKAYSLIQIKQYSKAKEVLDVIDPSACCWLKRREPYTVDELRQMIGSILE